MGLTRFPRAALLVLLALFTSGGCAAIPLATLGTLGGITASAVTTGRDVYKQGKLDTAEMATYDEIVHATLAAADDLDLTKREVNLWDDGHADVTCVDEHGAAVTIKLQRRTRTMSWIRIDVGAFGSEVAARLFLSRLRAHLPVAPSTAPASRVSGQS
jgi:hypothetical protein